MGFIIGGGWGSCLTTPKINKEIMIIEKDLSNDKT
mgnify:FL=1